MKYLCFCDSFGSIGYEIVNEGKDAKGCAQERNHNIEQSGNEEAGYWFVATKAMLAELRTTRDVYAIRPRDSQFKIVQK